MFLNKLDSSNLQNSVVIKNETSIQDLPTEVLSLIFQLSLEDSNITRYLHGAAQIKCVCKLWFNLVTTDNHWWYRIFSDIGCGIISPSQVIIDPPTWFERGQEAFYRDGIENGKWYERLNIAMTVANSMNFDPIDDSVCGVKMMQQLKQESCHLIFRDDGINRLAKHIVRYYNNFSELSKFEHLIEWEDLIENFDKLISTINFLSLDENSLTNIFMSIVDVFILVIDKSDDEKNFENFDLPCLFTKNQLELIKSSPEVNGSVNSYSYKQVICYWENPSKNTMPQP